MISSFDAGRIFQCKKKKGVTLKQIADETGCCVKTVKRVLAQGANYEPKPQPRATTKRVLARRKALDLLVKKVSKKGSRSWPTYGSAKELRSALKNKTGELVSERTIQRELHHLGYHPYVRQKVPTRSQVDLQKRRAFGKRMRSVPAKYRKRLVWSDESWLSCVERTGKVHWAKKKANVLPLEVKCRWNVPSVMIWGAVGMGFKSELIIFPSKREVDGEQKPYRLDAKRYIRKCLSTVVKDIVRFDRVFQQDGARAHASKHTLAYLKRMKVEFLPDWPPYSPDLSPIERIWKEMNCRVGARCPMDMDELIRFARECWASIPQSIIDRHCKHFETQIRDL